MCLLSNGKIITSELKSETSSFDKKVARTEKKLAACFKDQHALPFYCLYNFKCYYHNSSVNLSVNLAIDDITL